MKKFFLSILIVFHFFCKFSPEDDSLLKTYFLIELINYSTTESRFSKIASMSKQRTHHTASVLNDGKVLIVGGSSQSLPKGENALDSVELFDPDSETFSTTASMQYARVYHTATVLSDGKVLITGGSTPETNEAPTNTAELFDPTTESFTLISNNMNVPRKKHTATLLQSGKVLITGGINSDQSNVDNTAELYDPSTRSFTLVTASMNSERNQHRANILSSGKVLVTGGSDGKSTVNTTELYDPSTGSFTSSGNMTYSRAEHSTCVLEDGKILVVGGTNSAQIEVYDPDTATFTEITSFEYDEEYTSINNPIAVTLNNGLVFIAGGGIIDINNFNGYSSYSSNFFDPSICEISFAGAMNYERQIHTGSLLDSGKVLITGGNETTTNVTNTAEIFAPDKFILLGR